QRSDPPPRLTAPRRGRRDTGENLQECALAGAIPPDNADGLASVDLERDVVQSPEVAFVGRSTAPLSRDALDDLLPQASIPTDTLSRPNPVALGEALDADREIR